MPALNQFEKKHVYNSLIVPKLKSAFLLVEYVFLDKEERALFRESKQEYIIAKTGQKQEPESFIDY